MNTSKVIEIMGEEIAPGESRQIRVEVARLYTNTHVEVPIFVERAEEPGPVLLLMAGVHGDELNGVEVVRQMIRKKLNRPQRGTVVCMPVINVFGFLNQSRKFPDGRDLNRMFPGRLKGSLASRFAYYFTKHIMPSIDYAIDFHTGGGMRNNAPQVRCSFEDQATLELAQAFGAGFIVNSKQISKSVRATFSAKGKPALLFEGGRALDIDQDVVAVGVRGACNVMKHLGLIDGVPDVPTSAVVINRSRWLRASHSGLLHPKVKNGNHVERGEVLAHITDPYGQFEKTIAAPKAGCIYCVNESPVVNRADAIFHLSIDTEVKDTNTEQFFSLRDD